MNRIIQILIFQLFAVPVVAQQTYSYDMIPEGMITHIDDYRAGSCMSPNGPFLCDPYASPPTYAVQMADGCCNTISPAVKNATYCYTFTSPGTTVWLNAGFSFVATGGYSLWFDNFELYTCAPSCTLLPAYGAPVFTYTGLTTGACYTWCFDTNMTGGGASGGFTTLCPWMVYTGPLPVELENFHAWSEEQKVFINWSTASETNCMFYDVQRSPDGITFESIGQMPAHGTTSTTHQYAYTDFAPLNGTAYYRLRAVDFDSGEQYSNVIACITSNEPAQIRFYSLIGAEVLLDDAPMGMYIKEIISSGQAVRMLYYHTR